MCAALPLLLSYKYKFREEENIRDQHPHKRSYDDDDAIVLACFLSSSFFRVLFSFAKEIRKYMYKNAIIVVVASQISHEYYTQTQFFTHSHTRNLLLLNREGIIENSSLIEWKGTQKRECKTNTNALIFFLLIYLIGIKKDPRKIQRRHHMLSVEKKRCSTFQMIKSITFSLKFM